MSAPAETGGSTPNFVLMASTSGALLFAATVTLLLVAPVAPWAIDLAVASNLAVTIAILLCALANVPLKLSYWPKILLATVVFRVALNVAIARQILLQGDAGEIVRGFGTALTQGSWITGLVLLGIVTAVQLLVVTRGAERIAEVGARFSLDAMPGAQLAVDADQRSGAIDSFAAGRKRDELMAHSRTLGALDGAMKFVRGDAICTLVIVLVGFLGGIATGTLEAGLDAKSALARYGLLAFGDGLASQLSSLLVALAGAWIVARVETPQEGTRLRYSAATTVWGGAALLLVVLGLVPGLPFWPFATVALLLSLFLAARFARKKATGSHAPRAALLMLELPNPMGEPAAQERLAARFAQVAARKASALGLPINQHSKLVDVQIRPDLAADVFQIAARGVPIVRGALGPETAIELSIERAVSISAPEQISIEVVRRLLVQMADTHPSLCMAVRKRLSEIELAALFKQLLAESISIVDTEAIFEAIVASDGRGAELCEAVRKRMSRQLIAAVLRHKTSLSLIDLSASAEGLLRDSARPAKSMQPGQVSPLTLSPQSASDLELACERSIERALLSGHKVPIVVAPPDLRPLVRSAVAQRNPEIPVISFRELPAEVVCAVVETIALSGD